MFKVSSPVDLLEVPTKDPCGYLSVQPHTARSFDLDLPIQKDFRHGAFQPLLHVNVGPIAVSQRLGVLIGAIDSLSGSFCK